MSSQSTHLPEPALSGPLTVKVSALIDAPIERVWEVLTDFTKYNEWNPMSRSIEIVDKFGRTLQDQTPAKGKYIMMQSHVPHTMDDSIKTVPALELITHFDDVTHRVSWVPLLPWWRFMKAERWQGLSTTLDGKTLYESNEVFGGLGAYILKWFLSVPLTKSFEAAAEALKTRSEQSY